MWELARGERPGPGHREAWRCAREGYQESTSRQTLLGARSDPCTASPCPCTARLEAGVPCSVSGHCLAQGSCDLTAVCCFEWEEPTYLGAATRARWEGIDRHLEPGAGCALLLTAAGAPPCSPKAPQGEAEAAPSAGGQSCRPGPWGAWAGVPKPLLPFPVSNILKAAAGEGESSGSAKPHENVAGSNHEAQNKAGGAPLRRKEVTEEEAER